MSTQKCTCAKCTKPAVKTAEQFKLADMSQGMTNALNIGKAGLRSALPGALVGAGLGFVSAPEGQGMAGAARGAAAGGLATGAYGATHHGLMTGTSDAANDYRAYRQELGQRRALEHRAQNVDYIRQRNANIGSPTAPAPVVPAPVVPAPVAPPYAPPQSTAEANQFKPAMDLSGNTTYYGYGCNTALADFAI